MRGVALTNHTSKPFCLRILIIVLVIRLWIAHDPKNVGCLLSHNLCSDIELKINFAVRQQWLVTETAKDRCVDAPSAGLGRAKQQAK